MSSTNDRRSHKAARKRHARRKALVLAVLIAAVAVGVLVIDFFFSFSGYEPDIHEPKDFDRIDIQEQEGSSGRRSPWWPVSDRASIDHRYG